MAERGSKLLHSIDRSLGIPILFLLGLFVRNKKIPAEIRRIAILRTAAIGDTVLLSGIIKEIKISIPSVEITLVAGPSNIGITGSIPMLDKIVRIPVKNFLASVSIIRKMGEFDVVIDTGQWPRMDALLTYFFRTHFRIGFKTPGQYKHYIFNKKVNHSSTVHEIVNFRNLVKDFAKENSQLPELLIKRHEKISQLLLDYKNFIIFHPWPGGMNGNIKEWPVNNWSALAKLITDKGFHIFITGAPKDIENSNLIINSCGNIGITNLAGKFSLEETVELLSNAKLLISVNTGIMHIGSAINIPVIDLHGPTTSLRWGPLNNNSIAINSKGMGCGFINLGFEYEGNPENCMEQIRVEEVYDAFITLINSRA